MTKRCLTDIRNPARWTKADRGRCKPGDMAIVSNVWDRPPFGIRDVLTLPHIQPGVFRVDGKPAGIPGAFNYEWGQVVDDNPEWSLLTGLPVTLWSSGNQSLTAFDLSRLDVIEAWTDFLLAHFAWAGGIHHDYLTGYGWLEPDIPLAFWKQHDAGYACAIQRIRLRRPSWVFIGQQFHLTPLTPYVDGLYLEESPGHFGLSFEQIAANMDRHGHPEHWVIELRHPERFPITYQQQVARFAADHGSWLSWGMNEMALVGCPT